MNNLYDRTAIALHATDALRIVAGELPLVDILLELRDIYREAQQDEVLRHIRDYQVVCNASLRALDAALWRLESAEVIPFEDE
jgi:hypothetical protein